MQGEGERTGQVSPGITRLTASKDMSEPVALNSCQGLSGPFPACFPLLVTRVGSLCAYMAGCHIHGGRAVTSLLH